MNGLKHFAHVTLCLPLDLIRKRELSGGRHTFSGESYAKGVSTLSDESIP